MSSDDPIELINEAVSSGLDAVYDIMVRQRSDTRVPLGGTALKPAEYEEEDLRYLSEEGVRRSLFDDLAARYKVSNRPNPKTGKVAPIPRRWVEREKLAAKTLRKRQEKGERQ